MRTYEVTNEDMELIKKAYATLDKAKVEGNYYHTVGSCVRTKDGRTFEGVNCDCIHGSCAEFITIGKAISEGCHEFGTIVAVHPEGPAGLFAPCGNCRQMMMEYCPDIKVILAGQDNKIFKTDISELLPFAWTRLKNGGDLLQ